MRFRIKNWAQFQHFKDRKPPWVKLYRDLLDDIEWHELDAKAAKVLVMLWLIASESEGDLPEVKKLAFRLRMSEKDTKDCLSKLSHWLEQSDIKPISPRYQGDAPETEEEKRQREIREEAEALALKKKADAEEKARDFETFWAAYPRKEAKKDAETAWAHVAEPVATLLAAIEIKRRSEDWQKSKGQFIPLPATWLRGKRWEDEAPQVGQTVPAPANADAALQKIKADAAKATPPSLETLERMAQLRKAAPQGVRA